MKRVKFFKDTICLIVSFCLAVSLISFPVSAEESVTELMTDVEVSGEKDAVGILAEEQTVETEGNSKEKSTKEETKNSEVLQETDDFDRIPESYLSEEDELSTEEEKKQPVEESVPNGENEADIDIMAAQETEALSIAVDYPADISCGEEITFTVNASGGSGNYKYRLASLMTVEGGELASVYDISFGNNGSYRESNEFAFTFYASGTYYIRFSVMDMTTYQTKTTGLYDYTLSIQDSAYPSVTQIVENVAAQCMEECSTDFEKALWLHDWIIGRADYDYSYSYCSAEGVLARGKGTCESYHSAYVLLLNKVGIQTGRVTGNGHVWTAVKMDGEWYQIDTTWDDGGVQTEGTIYEHMYFGLTDDIIRLVHSDHTAAVPGYESTALENNYFIKTGEIKQWSDQFADTIKENLAEGKTEFILDVNDSMPNNYKNVIYNLVAYELSKTDWEGKELAVSYADNCLTCEVKAGEDDTNWVDANITDGLYSIICAGDNRFAADVKSGGAANGTNVQIYTQNASNAQKFYIHNLGNGKYVIYSYASGKALEVAGSSKANGGNIRINSYTGAENQQWEILTNNSGKYVFQSVHSGLVLDVSGGNFKDSTNLQQYRFNDSNAQRFELKSCNSQPVSNGTYTLMSAVSTGKVLDISGGSSSNSANLQLYQMNGSAAQQMKFTYDNADGTYTVRFVHSGKVLDISGGKISNGANAQQYVSNNSAAQKWVVRNEGSGYYSMFCIASGKALTLQNTSGANGTNVYQYDYSKANTQKFSFRDAKTIPASADCTIAEGVYTISTALKSSMVLDISSGSYANGANVQIYTSNQSDAQKFYVHAVSDKTYLLISLASGKVLEAAGTGSGANVRQNAYSGAANQKWKLRKDGNGYYTFVSAASGMVLDVSGAKPSNGTNVRIYASNATNSQKFVLTLCNSKPIQEGIYTIASALNTTKMLDIRGGSKADRANLQLYQSNGSAAQRFQFIYNSDGTYTIKNVNSGRALDVNGAGIKNGTNVQQYGGNGSTAQKWIMKAQGNGYYTFISLVSGKVMDIAGGSTANGTNAQIYEYNGSNAQKFLVK